MELIPLVLLATIVAKVVDLVRYATSRDWNGVSTIGTAWVAGIIGALLIGGTQFGDMIELSVGDRTLTLSALNVAERIVLGLGLASLLGVVVDFRPERSVPPMLLDTERKP